MVKDNQEWQKKQRCKRRWVGSKLTWKLEWKKLRNAIERSSKETISSCIKSRRTITYKRTNGTWIPTNPTTLFTTRTPTWIDIINCKFILNSNSIFQALSICFSSIKAIKPRIRTTLKLLQIHLKRRPKIHRCINTTSWYWNIKAHYWLTPIQESTNRHSSAAVAKRHSRWVVVVVSVVEHTGWGVNRGGAWAVE